MECRSIVLSVRPLMAEALISGGMRHEFRRVRPMINNGDIIYVYATSPVRAIVGTFICGDISEGDPDSLWRRLGAAAHTPRSLFREYFANAEMAAAIEVLEPKAWSEPLPLDAIRKKLSTFHPPQSYKFVEPEAMLDSILTRHASAENFLKVAPQIGAASPR